MVTKRKPNKRPHGADPQMPHAPALERERADAPASYAPVPELSDPTSPPPDGSFADASAEKTTSASRVHDERGGRKPKKKKRSLGLRILRVVAVVVLVVLLALTALYSWNRWFRFDDAFDFVGEWRIHGTDTTIIIDGECINLAEDAAYSYTLDTKAKTIQFTLGSMQGGGRYRFSLDRMQLVIEDGDYGSWPTNALKDLPWLVNDLMNLLFATPLTEPSGENLSVLDRPERQESADASAADGDAATTDGAAADKTDVEEGAASEDTSTGQAGGNAVTVEDLEASGAAGAFGVSGEAGASGAAGASGEAGVPGEPGNAGGLGSTGESVSSNNPEDLGNPSNVQEPGVSEGGSQ